MFENGLVGVVIVTFNRLNKLKITLKSFEKQTVKPAYILVLNNASTDETKEYLENWKLTVATYSKYVINSDNNMGGSGGFHKGMYEALHLPAKWIWVQDDDAFPATNAIEIATAFLNTNTDKWDSISAICGKVVNKNRIDTAHRRIIYEKRYGRILCRDVKTEMYSRDCFKINAFSYVGTVINTNKLLEVGLTNKDFFIWFDDTEHSLRLSRKGSILCIPAIEIVHNVEQSASDTTWKNYYGVRNLE